MTTVLALAALLSQSPAAPRVVRPALYDFTLAQVTCDGGAPRSVLTVKPLPASGYAVFDEGVAPYLLTFRIDADGRPLSIVAEKREASVYYTPASDLQPALAASRFAAGAPRARCTARYGVQAFPVDTAPRDLVHRYLALPHDQSTSGGEVQRRARESTGDCFTGRAPSVLLRAYPDFQHIPQPSGELSMTLVGFDIDRRGRPVRIRTEVSDGHHALDEAGRRAVAKSRFAAGARTGCTYPYYRRQSTPMAPPEPPPAADFRKAGSGCHEDDVPWQLPPRLTFPEPFRRRAIEGWAVIRYDVAPWGQTGNVSVIASEPAAMFGEQARQIIMAAKRPLSERGATGCVDRVRFKLPATEAEAMPPAPVAMH